jgi:hypothetical protein
MKSKFSLELAHMQADAYAGEEQTATRGKARFYQHRVLSH